MNKNLSLYLNVFKFHSLDYLLKKIKDAHAVRCSNTACGKTEIRVGFPAWAHNLMLKTQSKQCNTNTQLFVDFSTIKSFWCPNIVNTLCFTGVFYGTTNKRHSKCLKRLSRSIRYGICIDAV